jgi:cardiolipin synthase
MLPHPEPKPVEKVVENRSSGDLVRLLDGGAQAFPRMLDAIRGALKSVHLEVYSFALDSIGQVFVQALIGASRRGVAVRVIIDAWGSLGSGRAVAARLAAAGCRVTVFNPLSALFAGRFRRNHRKLLIVDEAVVYVGGINIGEHYAGKEVLGWADLALEVRGLAVARLSAMLKGARWPHTDPGGVRIYLSGLRGGGVLLRRYLKAIRGAQHHVLLAHAYFLPNRRLVRALVAAAGRGVRVTLLLAGRSDVPFSRAATRRLYGRFTRAGVELYEWNRSVLHAKAATADSKVFLVGSFNLDPLSLANLEALVEVSEPEAVQEGERWITSKLSEADRIDPHKHPRPVLVRWVSDVVGLWAARFVQWIARLISREGRRPRRTRRLMS